MQNFILNLRCKAKINQTVSHLIVNHNFKLKNLRSYLNRTFITEFSLGLDFSHILILLLARFTQQNMKISLVSLDCLSYNT